MLLEFRLKFNQSIFTNYIPMELKNRKLTRFLDVSSKAINEKDRTAVLAFSSESPYERDFGIEILDHSPESVNLQRLKDGAPLLVDHDHTDHIGVVERVFLGEDKVGRVVVRFGTSARAQEVFSDVLEGIRRHVSVGYQISDYRLEEQATRSGEPDIYRVTNWTPYEVSLVSVPADHSVGIGRSHSILTKGKPKMNTPELQSARDKEANRIDEIREIGLQNDCSDLATESIRDGISVDGFLRRVLELRGHDDVIQAEAPSSMQSRATAFNKPTDKHEYSLVNVIRSLAGEKGIDIGYETELHQEIQHQKGKRSKGFSIPIEQLSKRAMTASGTGSSLVHDVYQPDMMVEFLRNKSVVINNGAQGIQLNDGGNIVLPRQTGTATAEWLDLDGTDSITPSDQSFDQIELNMKTLTAMTTYTHRMLKQGLPGIEQLIVRDLSELFAVEIDKTALNGSATDAKQPTGILNQTGILGVDYTTEPDFSTVLNMEAELAENNISTSGLVYITTPTLAMLLKGKEKATNTGQFIWTQGPENEGMVNGFKACYTKNMPADTILLANLQDLMIGYWGSIEIDVDPYGDNFRKGNVSVRAMMDVDMNLRRVTSFCKATPAA